MKNSLNSILLVFLLTSAVKGEEFFSSLLLLEKLAIQQGQLIEKLKEVANELKSEYVNRKLQYFQYEHDLMQQDVAKYIENPLHAFSMIKRATTDLSLIIERIPTEQADKLKIFHITDSSLTHAVRGLLLIQRIYKLRTRDIARGIVQSRRIGGKMTPHDLYVIGNIASNLTNEDFFAREYLELALEKTKEGHDSKVNEINESSLLMKIAQVCERMRDYRCSALHLKQIMTSHPNDVEVATFALRIAQLFRANTDAKIKTDDPFVGVEEIERNGEFTPLKERALISDVCSGKLIQNAMEISKLHCFFITTNSYSKIAPFKAEAVNLNPYILLYYDAMSSNEILSLKTFLRQQKMDEKSSNVIRMASLFDNESELAERISRRIEDMTGLSMDVKEPLNLYHYGVGGPFWDQRIKRHKMAMILFYMNDDHQDGATAFPYLKLKISPPKGSALLWFTLKRTGQREYGTRFTQCPVTNKSKWIAMKNILQQKYPTWLSEGNTENELTLKDYDEKFF